MSVILKYLSDIRVVIGLAVLIVLIMIILIVQKINSGKARKQLEDLEDRYNTIKKVPLSFKLNKAVAISRIVPDAMAKVTNMKDDFDKCEANLKQIGQALADAEDEIIAGKLKKAIVYSLNQREYLCAFLDHGEIEISNNQVENAIRPIVVGRKNWLFCDTQAGANASVIVFTVLETAKANGLNPEAYLNHLLSVLPERFADNLQASVDDLMPWDEDIRLAFGSSDAEH